MKRFVRSLTLRLYGENLVWGLWPEAHVQTWPGLLLFSYYLFWGMLFLRRPLPITTGSFKPGLWESCHGCLSIVNCKAIDPTLFKTNIGIYYYCIHYIGLSPTSPPIQPPYHCAQIESRQLHQNVDTAATRIFGGDCGVCVSHLSYRWVFED